jgi:hypothetical protein
MARINFTLLELEVLKRLLLGEDPVLEELRKQLALSKATSREITGHGFYLHFELPKEIKGIHEYLPVKPTFCFGDVEAKIDSLRYGAGFLLWIKEGILSSLEGYTYDEEWPQKVNSFEVHYFNNNLRNLEKIRHAWILNPSTE